MLERTIRTISWERGLTPVSLHCLSTMFSSSSIWLRNRSFWACKHSSSDAAEFETTRSTWFSRECSIAKFKNWTFRLVKQIETSHTLRFPLNSRRKNQPHAEKSDIPFELKLGFHEQRETEIIRSTCLIERWTMNSERWRLTLSRIKCVLFSSHHLLQLGRPDFLHQRLFSLVSTHNSTPLSAC